MWKIYIDIAAMLVHFFLGQIVYSKSAPVSSNALAVCIVRYHKELV